MKKETEDLAQQMKTNKELKKLYPWLMVKNCWTGEPIDDSEDDFIELDFMPEGWRIAFGDKMCKELDNILKKGNYTYEYRIMQIKEKYGCLRWYDNGVPTHIAKKYNEWLRKYEKRSTKTCYFCGKHGKIYDINSWLIPLCKKCKKEKEM